MIPHPWEISQKKLKKIFNGGFSCNSLYYGKFPHKKNFSIQEIPTTFFPMGNSPRFFLPTPYGKFPKKIWKKIFSSGYMDNCSPKNGGAPWGEGGWGDTYPPLWGIWGGVIAC